MEDKQIIIDVSKCKECGLRNCEGTLIYWCHTYDDHCADFNDCYYKQLKAKEQECEELKKIINEAKNSKLDLKSFLVGEAIQNEYEQQLNQLKAENDELKKLLKVRIEDLCDSCGASSMMPMPCKVYEKTLTEIKEIAENYTKRNYAAFKFALQQILQKIIEVEK